MGFSPVDDKQVLGRFFGKAGGTILLVLLLPHCQVPVYAATNGLTPSPRSHFGFTATPEHVIYLFGGVHGGQ